MNKYLFYSELGHEISYPIGCNFDGNNSPNRKGSTYKLASDIVSKLIELFNEAKSDVAFYLIGRGSSGHILCGAVGYDLVRNGFKVKVIVSRKPGEQCHSRDLMGLTSDYNAMTSEGKSIRRVYIVLDDFLVSGETVKQILEDVAAAGVSGPLDYLFVSNQGLSSTFGNRRFSIICEGFKQICIYKKSE